MVAGLHMKVNVIRISQLADDASGGAITTGTVVHNDLASVLTPRRPSQIMLEQGLEVDAIYDFTTTAQGVTLFERDEMQVTWPPAHALFGLRFRIEGVQPGRKRARFAALHCTLSRIRESRTSQ